jgi:hypothetical protein
LAAALATVILEVCLNKRTAVAQTGSTPKTKTKTPPSGTAKVSGQWERALLDLERDYLAPLDGPEAKIAVGTTVNLLLDSGKRFDDVEVTEWLLGKGQDTVRAIAVKNAAKKTKQRFQISAIAQIHSGDRLFDVVFDREKKGYVLIDGAKRDEVVTGRLRPSGNRLWGEFSDDEQAKFVEEHKAFLKRVGEGFAPTPMYLSETEYFLFYTDMPLAQLGGYVAYLDAMYLELCKAFGVPRGKNIWRGKCVILAFSQKALYQRFEREFMQNEAPESSQGLHHGSGDGKAITACWRGADPAFFAHVLVHETSHGFMHRFRSTVHVLPWINEGVADWVAVAVVRNCPETERRQRDAVAEMQRTGGMGGNFFADQTLLQRWQYGTASHLTSFLLSVDATRYRALITGIKEGFTWEESLKPAYGWSQAELVRRYGVSISVPNLQP